MYLLRNQRTQRCLYVGPRGLGSQTGMPSLREEPLLGPALHPHEGTKGPPGPSHLLQKSDIPDGADLRACTVANIGGTNFCIARADPNHIHPRHTSGNF